MPRFLVSVSSEDDIYGSIYTVDAPSDRDAFDAVCDDKGGEGDVIVLGTCEEVAELGRSRQVGIVDYVVGGGT